MRKEGDDWFELIARYCSEKNKTDVTVTDVLCDNQWIMKKSDAISRGDMMRAGSILKQLNYQRYNKRIANGFAWRYRLAT